MPINSIVLLIVCAFAFIPLLLAEYARNRTTPTISDFFLQGRKMGIFSMYVTVFSTWMSAFAFMGAISYFYEQGPIYMTTVGWDALFAVLFYLVGRRIWYYGKTYGYVTPADFFQDIYQSRPLTLLVTVMCIVFPLLYIQIQMVGGLFLLQIATDGYISWKVSGLIFLVILVVYLWAGGLRAIAFTDAFYGVLIMITIVASGLFLMVQAGGMDSLFQKVVEQDVTNVTMSGPSGFKRIGLWLSLFLIVPIGAFMGPQIWIRNYAAGESRHFERLPFFLCLSSIICIGTLFAGSAGILLNKSEVNDDTLIVHLMLQYAPPIFCTFIFIGIASAVLSTANSIIHALSAVYTMDIHKKYINPRMPEQGLLSIAKSAVLIVSLISYMLLYIIPQSIFDTGVIALGGMAQLLVPTLGALFWKKSTAGGAVTGLMCGIVLLILLSIIVGIDSSYCAVLALLVNGTVFIMMGIFHRGRRPWEKKIAAYRSIFLEKIK